MKANVYSIEGKEIKKIDLPKVFNSDIDENLIKRAVLAVESAQFQAMGVKPGAGRNSTAEYIGDRGKPQMHRLINVAHARLPRTKNRKYILSGRVANVPQAVGGPKAHPPKVEKKLEERINKKERKKAIKSAIAATAVKEIVKKRGHKFNDKLEFPIVIENKLETIEKTKNIIEFMKVLGVNEDIERAKKRKTLKAGKGKRRGRKYSKAKSVLFVVDNNEKVYKSARNIEGVDVTKVDDLNAKLLAPGTHAGRLTIWSEAAIEKIRSI